MEDNQLTLLQVYAKWKDQDLKTTPTVEGVMPFDPAVFDWLKGYDGVKNTTKPVYKASFNLLVKVKPTMTVADILDVLREYRKRCIKKGTHRQFNITRNCCR